MTIQTTLGIQLIREIPNIKIDSIESFSLDLNEETVGVLSISAIGDFVLRLLEKKERN